MGYRALLARGLSRLLFFPVEGHLDVRQGKLNASSDIRDRQSEFPRISFREGLRYKATKESELYQACCLRE